LNKRARAEELQKKHPKRWRYSERILRRVRSLYRKARNVVIDRCWKLARKVDLQSVEAEVRDRLRGPRRPPGEHQRKGQED